MADHDSRTNMAQTQIEQFQAPQAPMMGQQEYVFKQARPVHWTPSIVGGPSNERFARSASQRLSIDSNLRCMGSRAVSIDTMSPSTNCPDEQRQSMPPFYPYDCKENMGLPGHGPQGTLMKHNGLDTLRRNSSKGSSASQASDQELRRLFQENCHRGMKDVAVSVLENERGPRAEKAKQIFAMNWLSRVCRKAETSVPRNRVYSHYAQRCGTERVPLLNPASFGKLVRIIFPDIQTRRLGMRGESKYHYVDLALVESDLEATPAPEPSSVKIAPARAPPPADTADFPSPAPIQPPPPTRTGLMNHREASGNLYLDRRHPQIHKGPSWSNMISRRLKFPTYSENEFPDDGPIVLPDLQEYLPKGTDPDVAGALKALYRAHCVSVIDCVRYCKEKPFWHHFTSFHGTLTVPVQKLFVHAKLAPWIKKCDWLMYQKMIQFVSPLALQVVPDAVTAVFQSISDNLGRHILETFGQHPSHVRDAKHGPAVIFAGLLGRLLRVNAASHAAAHILGNDATRSQMWHDWVYHVKPPVVVETCLPGAGYSRTVQILTTEIRDLLSPLAVKSYPGMQHIFITPDTGSGEDAQPCGEVDGSSTSSVLDRWINFLHSLPSRFPAADARTLLHCVSDVGTAALRDITMATAVSFGQWTVTKVWVDEMMQWLAEKGGFLENEASTSEMRPPKRKAEHAGMTQQDASRRQAQYANQNSSAQQTRPQDKPAHKAADNAEETEYDAHDDSAIGLELETPTHMAGTRKNDYGGFVASTMSDPADVVVC